MGEVIKHCSLVMQSQVGLIREAFSSERGTICLSGVIVSFLMELQSPVGIWWKCQNMAINNDIIYVFGVLWYAIVLNFQVNPRLKICWPWLSFKLTVNPELMISTGSNPVSLDWAVINVGYWVKHVHGLQDMERTMDMDLYQPLKMNVRFLIVKM